MKKVVLAAALLVSSFGVAHAKTVFLDALIAHNVAGGKIIVTEESCSRGGLLTISTLPSTRIRHKGCATGVNGRVVVYWDDGSQTSYWRSSFVRSRAWITV